MGQSKPWRQPLKERQAFAVSQEPWQPKSVSSTAWKDIVADNPVNKSIGESSKFDLDTTGHYKDLDEERSDEENFDPKPLSRLTLQVSYSVIGIYFYFNPIYLKKKPTLNLPGKLWCFGNNNFNIDIISIIIYCELGFPIHC